MILTVEAFMRVAIERGIAVRRIMQPLCMHRGEPICMKTIRIIDPLALLNNWNDNDTLLIYKVYMRPLDELLTVRYAKGIGQPYTEDI